MDYTASGQDLYFIMNHCMKALEKFANTHTENSHTGAYMSHLLNESYKLIMDACNADLRDYFILAQGQGTTMAIEMTQKILGTYMPPGTIDRMGSSYTELKNKLREDNKLPLVIVGPYEHHSNVITWRNQLCDVKELDLQEDGHVDL